MDRCVVLVDAGYLLGAAASLLAGEPGRARIAVDHPVLIAALRERAEAETGLPLLRIYWFDAAVDRRPAPEHRRLRVLPRVTVRLGALTRAEGRWVQKGVDAAMHAELSELARNHACADVVLVTGDGDLLPGVASAKEHGVALHLWALEAADGDFNQSEELVGEADERRVLDRAWIQRWARPREAAAEPAVAVAPVAVLPAPARPRTVPLVPAPAPAAVVAAARSTPLRVIPTPKDLAGRAATGPPAGPAAPAGPVLRWSSDRGLVDRADAATAADALPTLDRLTTSAQRWADREEDITSVGGDPQEVGQVFARRWLDRLADAGRPALLWADHPRIPHRLDGELLRYAARFGLLAHKEDQIDEQDRYAIREGFWKELAARVPDARQPPEALRED
ncbi:MULTISPECIES: NYN domain-containing protein [Kitasatospora]|uniref:NYN domain-containing protein n=1 Tax=Kitasatospora TaxID=2063 RepID=UPI0022838304|nr:NYN domain-containing protein [Kitasatospora sp. YST-16]WAL76315.1 NYN domain-containing protein [Kitasatospora sp. YST-16]WNW42354.1 NYN domain-containing protein [Streptomyces sp. Li-HN-5-13]